jgi:UDP-glucose 4-epimerase
MAEEIMKVLVTGGAGFIGSHVARRLVEGGHTVAVLDDLSGGYRRNVPDVAEWFQHSLVDANATLMSLRRFQPDVVFHAAAYAAEGLSHWMRRFNYTENLVSWANLADAIIRSDVPRVAVCSSMAVYGSQVPPFDEKLTPQPEDPYGAAKAAMEVDVRALADVFDVSPVIFRPHNVYGPGQNLADPYRNVVAIFMRQALAGEPLTVFGDGGQVRAFSFIDDVARALADVALSDHEGIVNVGGEEPTTILDLALRVKDATGSSSKIVHLPPRHEVRDAFCSHDVLRSLVGEWDPTRMDAGIPAMAAWARGVAIAPPRQYDYEVTRNLYQSWRRP